MQPTEIKFSKSPRILIVEDDPDQLKLLVKLIRQSLNCELLEATDGLEGLKIMLQDKQVPDLILLDLMLPYLSGVEFLTIVRGRSEFSRVPIIVCTAVDEKSELKRKIVSHIHSYLVKPIVKEKLLEKILDALHPICIRVDYN